MYVLDLTCQFVIEPFGEAIWVFTKLLDAPSKFSSTKKICSFDHVAVKSII
jgi:hypothetical protein